MSREAGYATVTVTALMMGLSVLAIAWMERSVTASRSADRLSAQILADIYQEGAINDALGQLINSRGKPEASMQQMRFRSAGHEAIVSVSPMRDLVDINAASIDEIENRLRGLPVSPLQQRDILTRIRSHRAQGDDRIMSLQELGDGEEFAASLPCLEQGLTVFHDPSPPIRRGEGAKLGEGSLVRIRSRAPARNDMVEAVVLITGVSEEPYWIYDWKHTDETEHAYC